MENKSIADVIGRNARKLRLDNDVTLDALAAEARKAGLKWSTARVVDLERGKLSPTIPMLIALSFAMGRATKTDVRLADLLADAEPVQVNEKLTVPGAELEDILTGAPVRLWSRTWDAVSEAVQQYPESLTVADALVWDSYGLGDERAAKRLGLSKPEMVRRSVSLWGHNLSAERDKRSGADANAQTRGRITRALLDELRSAGNGDD